MRAAHARTATLAIAACASCSSSAPPRAELVVVIDTDAHLVGELADRAEVSPDAAIDTVRVDVLDANDKIYDSQTLIVPDKESWPITFGVLPNGSATEVRLRIRAFRGRFGQAGVVNGGATVDPPADVTIDRLAVFALPKSDLSRARVSLATDCIGTPSSFLSPVKTCVDAAHLAGDPHTGIDTSNGDAPSSVGTWQPAIAVACSAPQRDKTNCISGGFSILGEYSAVGLGGTPRPVPLKPTIVSPFLLDTYEYTVARFRAFVASGYAGDMPIVQDPTNAINRYCTWRGPNDPSNDSYPLNCVDWPVAEKACEKEGGTLPTEAQYEHAARGRGERRTFPWGDADPTCACISASRQGQFMGANECRGAGVEPVGSHPVTAACPNADVSRDGVFDLGGSLIEAMLDDSAPYTAPCWTPGGVLRDPRCQVGGMGLPASSRGTDWSAGLASAAGARRDVFSKGANTGFRCAYPGGSR
jgi:formylglycine-generating enzyme required for sulfatase activity